MSMFIEAYRRVFPLVRLSIFQMEMIEASVTDFNAWQEALMFWAGNDYRGQSVFKIIEYYKEIQRGLVKNGRVLDTVGRYEPNQAYEPVSGCSICGKDICFELHREDV